MTMTIVMVLSSWRNHCESSSHECRLSTRRLSTLI